MLRERIRNFVIYGGRASKISHLERRKDTLERVVSERLVTARDQRINVPADANIPDGAALYVPTGPRNSAHKIYFSTKGGVPERAGHPGYLVLDDIAVIRTNGKAHIHPSEQFMKGPYVIDRADIDSFDLLRPEASGDLRKSVERYHRLRVRIDDERADISYLGRLLRLA